MLSELNWGISGRGYSKGCKYMWFCFVFVVIKIFCHIQTITYHDRYNYLISHIVIWCYRWQKELFKPDSPDFTRETDYELETPVAAPSSITNDSSNDTDIVTVTYM